MAGPPTSVAGTALAGVNASAHCPTYAGGNVSAHGPHSGPYLLLGLFLPGVASPLTNTHVFRFRGPATKLIRSTKVPF